jgi:pSer/pThr/pTyr-binding forkhead associated (FHA) protein
MLSPYISVTLMSGPRDGEVLRFDINPEDAEIILTIGRRDTCDICLNYDSQVSRLHAQIRYDGEGFWLEDLDSRNGTFLNGKRVENRSPITPGTLFRVGRTSLRLDPLPPDETQTSRPISDDSGDPF